MYIVPLVAVPNQRISFNIDSAFWQLHIYQSISFMCIDIVQNGVPVVTGNRCFGGVPLMPYEYMFDPNYGNFVFDSDGDWTNFGTDGSCNLYYLQVNEFDEFMETIKVGY
jgi:hypothetical protein